MEDEIGSPAGGPPWMSSSTSVVATAEPPCRTSQGSAINVFINYGGGRCRTSRRHPQGGCYRRLLQLLWWPLPDLPAAPPRGPAIDILLNYSGGHCQTSRQHPPRGLPSMFCLTTVVAIAGSPSSAPRGPAIDLLLNLVAVASILLAIPSRGHFGKHYYYEQGKSLRKNIFGSLQC
jgi:hypothetical protein